MSNLYERYSQLLQEHQQIYSDMDRRFGPNNIEETQLRHATRKEAQVLLRESVDIFVRDYLINSNINAQCNGQGRILNSGKHLGVTIINLDSVSIGTIHNYLESYYNGGNFRPYIEFRSITTPNMVENGGKQAYELILNIDQFMNGINSNIKYNHQQQNNKSMEKYTSDTITTTNRREENNKKIKKQKYNTFKIFIILVLIVGFVAVIFHFKDSADLSIFTSLLNSKGDNTDLK